MRVLQLSSCSVLPDLAACQYHKPHLSIRLNLKINISLCIMLKHSSFSEFKPLESTESIEFAVVIFTFKITKNSILLILQNE